MILRPFYCASLHLYVHSLYNTYGKEIAMECPSCKKWCETMSADIPCPHCGYDMHNPIPVDQEILHELKVLSGYTKIIKNSVMAIIWIIIIPIVICAVITVIKFSS